jgi:hypothetical protein
MQPDGEVLVWLALAVFVPLALGVMIQGIYRTWVEYRWRSQALDVLRVYAEKGQDPPASVTAVVAAFASERRHSTHGAPTPARGCSKPTRESHLAHVVGSVVCAIGAAGIAWWRMPAEGAPGALVMWAVVFAIFFAGSAAARLVGAFTSPSGQFRNGG